MFGDDLIGETSIDLDDRFFSPDWQSMKEKPVEYRELYHPSTSVNQGQIKCWVEITETVSSSKMEEPWDITPPPIKDMEIRVVVWDTKDVVMMDAEGTSDVFIKVWVENDKKKETDCHYRCTNGKASFNYRLIYDTKVPRTENDLTVQIWDRDLFKSNDFIGSAQLSLKHLFNDAYVTGKGIELNKKYWTSYLQKQLGMKLEWEDEDSFWLPCIGVNDKGLE